jgi:uncharacterized protein YndB with AHSA1/START domain
MGLNVTITADRELRIERVFDAPRERVWEAHTKPELLAQWWGRGNPLDIEALEVEPDGRWRFVEHSEGESFGFEGRFLEVVPPERLVYTFGWDGMPGHEVVDATDFLDLGDGRTKVVTISTFETTEDRDGMIEAGMEEGLAQSYEALDRLLAAQD